MKEILSAFRLLRRRPGLAVPAVLALALGIGANTAVFSAVHAVLLAPFPFAAPERLAVLWKTQPELDAAVVEVSYPEFREWQRQSESFTGLGAVSASAYQAALTGRDRPLSLSGALVSGELFSVLGARPAEGRLLAPGDDRQGAEPVVVLSDGLRRRLFGSGRAVGQRLILAGDTYTVAGVLPPGFDFPRGAEFWAPVALVQPEAAQDPTVGFLRVVGRLKEGVSIERARTEMDGVVRRVAQGFGAPGPSPGVAVTPIVEHLLGDTREGIWILFGVVTLVLLIACADVANLLLARAGGRRGELAVRSALGAERGRLVRQLLAEGVPLAVLGGLGGLILAALGIQLLNVLGPPEIPRLGDVRLSAPVLGFTVLLSFLALAISTTLPAVQTARKVDFRDVLSESSGGSIRGRASRRWMSLLLAAQAGMAVLLLVVTGLLVSRFRDLQRIDLGFRPEGALSAQILLDAPEYAEPPRAHAFHDALLERLRGLPGVESAGAVLLPPLESDIGWDFTVTAEGQSLEQHLANPKVNFETATPGYFEAMGIPVVAGRGFTGQDRAGSVPVAVLSEGLARRLWPGGDAVGKRIKNFGPDHPSPWRMVIGVVGDVRYRGLAAPTLDFYVPHWQAPLAPTTVVVRTGSDPVRLAPDLQREVQALDADQPVAKITTLEAQVASRLAEPRLLASLSILFAGLATVLAAVGIYGVISYAAARRTREIGLRMALGASRPDVLLLVAREGLAPAATGAALGLLAAFWSGRALSAWLSGAAAADPAVFLATALLLVLAAAVAVYLPSRRAMKLDPSLALRED